MKRKACRAILLTPDEEILLIKIANPSSAWAGWIAPGGGIDDGESQQQALKRELKEELGFDLRHEAPAVWTRSLAFTWAGQEYEQDEVFFLVRTVKFEPAGAALTDLEMRDFKEIKWWRLDELAASGELTAPSNVSALVRELIDQGLPQSPVGVGA